MEEAYFKRTGALVILAVLLVLSFLIVQPIVLSIFMGVILAVIFSPVYDWLYGKTKAPNISSTLICILLILLIIIPIWVLTPIFIKQSFEVYQFSQQIDFSKALESVFPSLFASQEFSQQIGSVIHSFVTNVTNSIVNSFSAIILNFLPFFFQLLVVFFTLFFILRDREQFFLYVKSLSPFSKEVESKLFKSSKDITLSVIYGQVVIGIIQGVIAGMGFFVFGVTNALFLTFLASLAGIFPVIGTAVVWLPVSIYLIVGGNTLPAIGVVIFGIFSSSIDNVLRPFFVSKRTSMHPLILMIGMIGGLFFFGILGFILGPLILAYVLIILETYRTHHVQGAFIMPKK